MNISGGLMLAVMVSGMAAGVIRADDTPQIKTEQTETGSSNRLRSPPPPVRIISAPGREPLQAGDWVQSQGVMVWQLDTVSCGNGANDAGLAVQMARPRSTLETVRFPKDEGRLRRLLSQQSRRGEVQFDIDASGRAVSVKGGIGDTAAAVAASRFPAVARSGCTARFSGQTSPMAYAPVSDLLAYTVNAVSGALPREGWARIAAGGNCTGDGTPDSKQAPLLRGFPDFQHIPGTPGAREWSAIGYDTNAAGKPIHVHVRASSGSAALDAAAVKAVQASRFTGGARTGCTYPYWRKALALPAPEMPGKEQFPSGTGCPPDVILSEQQKAALSRNYPRYFSDRQIEGWAIIGYDVAPWGEVGNVSVLAAQPASVFGDATKFIVITAKVAPSPSGASGCVQRVRFRLEPVKSAEAQEGVSDGLDDIAL